LSILFLYKKQEHLQILHAEYAKIYARCANILDYEIIGSKMIMQAKAEDNLFKVPSNMRGLIF